VILLLIGLVLVPIAVRVWARRYMPQFSGTVTGIGFGLVVSPLSLGLYATYFLGPLGIVTGMVGLISVLFHGAPGYNIATSLGIVPQGELWKVLAIFTCKQQTVYFGLLCMAHWDGSLIACVGQELRSNRAAHPDARRASRQFQAPWARAGGRGR